MAKDRVSESFIANRLSGGTIPGDLAILLQHAEELADRSGIELNWEKSWAPWADTSYLTKTDRQNPDVMANVRAIAEVCKWITFVAANDEDECFGYWRGPSMRPLVESPLVLFDNEGQFTLCGSDFCEAVLSQISDGVERVEMKEWFRSLDIEVRAERFEGFARHPDDPGPDRMHEDLYYSYLGRRPAS